MAVKLQNLIIIPKRVVEEANKACTDDSDNGFARSLKAADEFTDAGLTPMFVLDPECMDLIVVCKETFGKKLN